MLSSEIISNAVKVLSLKQDDEDKNSFYKECPIGGDTLLVIRVSNHRTYLQTWADRYKPTMIPSNKILRRMGRNLPIIYRKKLFYSFVFEDNQDTVGNTAVNGNRIVIVNEVVNKAFDFSVDRMNLYIKALSNLCSNQYNEEILGKYKEVTNKSNLNCNRTMKQTIRLTESQFRQVIKESVIKILNEQVQNEGWAKNAAMATAIGAASIFGGQNKANAQGINNQQNTEIRGEYGYENDSEKMPRR